MLMAARPEVMILNESSIRMELLSQGYKTREVGIILSLAAQYQEEITPTDPDKTIVTGEQEKVTINFHRVAPGPLTDLIENVEEVARALEGTAYEWMLEEG